MAKVQKSYTVEFVCYVEFAKFAHNLHYVDYERLPSEELSGDGASIPHNLNPAAARRSRFLERTRLTGNPAGAPDLVDQLQYRTTLCPPGAPGWAT